MSDGEGIRRALRDANLTVCAEFHLGTWPKCDDDDHEGYEAAAEELVDLLQERDAYLAELERIRDLHTILIGNPFSSVAREVIVDVRRAIALRADGQA